MFACRLNAVYLGYSKDPGVGWDAGDVCRGCSYDFWFLGLVGLLLLLEVGGSSLLPFISVIGGVVGEVFWLGLAW